MSGNPKCTLYIGNVDEKVDEKLLYEVMIQAGPLVDVYMPRDKESNRHKGFAFAEYENEEIAQYAVKLFSGLVSLNNKKLRFAFSGQDKEKSSPPQIAIVQSNEKRISPENSFETPSAKSRKIPTHPCRLASRYSPYASPAANPSPAYNTNGVINNGYNMAGNFQSTTNNYYPYVTEGRILDHCLSSVNRFDSRASLLGSSRYPEVYSSY